MSLVVNHNLMAANVARNLNTHYGKLAQSTQRLSTGLRVNSAADDAAGLAIRELQRADIAALHQGARNANDAVSMIQTADGALAIIDEKLIRMKELAEQAATGTYDSTQRLMIDSEFQAMAAEIDRIANATDFNGIHLLNGNLSGAHDGSGLNSTGAMKIHFGSGNDSSEDYYYVNIDNCTVRSLFPKAVKYKKIVNTENRNETYFVDWSKNGSIDENGNYVYEVKRKIAQTWSTGIDAVILPPGLQDVIIEADSDLDFYHKPHVNLFHNDGTQLTGYSPDDDTTVITLNKGGTVTGTRAWWTNMSGATIVQGEGFSKNPPAVYSNNIINNAGQNVNYDGINVTILATQNEARNSPEIIKIDTVTSGLVFLIGGHNNPDGGCNVYNLKITSKTPPDLSKYQDVEDTEYSGRLEKEMLDLDMHIDTQEKAQKMLDHIDVAIENKDKIRAHLGALQNRLENTITNITTQAENLQAAESRISDVDVATEMTEFVRQQILAQSAVAMLSQANSMPQMAMQIIGG